MNTLVNPNIVIGGFKRFGDFGPAYEVLGIVNDKPVKEPMIRILVLESGEELDYPVRQYVEDVEA